MNICVSEDGHQVSVPWHWYIFYVRIIHCSVAVKHIMSRSYCKESVLYDDILHCMVKALICDFFWDHINILGEFDL